MCTNVLQIICSDLMTIELDSVEESVFKRAFEDDEGVEGSEVKVSKLVASTPIKKLKCF